MQRVSTGFGHDQGELQPALKSTPHVSGTQQLFWQQPLSGQTVSGVAGFHPMPQSGKNSLQSLGLQHNSSVQTPSGQMVSNAICFPGTQRSSELLADGKNADPEVS
jgi:hypothetical protein